MNLVLIGYRGTGKSMVGQVLAERLGRTLASTDELIVKDAGKSIPDIVAESGWKTFRDIETRVILTVTKQDGQVLDCGGGAILRRENREALRSGGFVVWLRAMPATIVNRIADDDQRPSLTGPRSFTEEVEEVLEQRTPLYREAAHAEVETDELTMEEVANRVCRAFQEFAV